MWAFFRRNLNLCWQGVKTSSRELRVLASEGLKGSKKFIIRLTNTVTVELKNFYYGLIFYISGLDTLYISMFLYVLYYKYYIFL